MLYLILIEYLYLKLQESRHNVVVVKAYVNSGLKKRILGGIEVGMTEVIDDLKKSLRTHEDEISIYTDQGKRLSFLLKSTGLNQFMKVGALRKAWSDTIDDIKVDNRYKNITIKLFDSTILDKNTQWIGLPYNPDDEKKKPKKQKLRTDSRNNRENDPSKFVAGPKFGVVKDGYRPLPSRGSFRWRQNPYPDRGYWMIYDQGYLGDGISYYPSHFITQAMSEVLGESIGRLYAYDNTLTLSSRLLHKIEKVVAKNINARR